MVKRQFGRHDSNNDHRDHGSGTMQGDAEFGVRRSNWRTGYSLVLPALCVGLLLSVPPLWAQEQGAGAGADEGETVVGFEIPDYHEDGVLKSVLKAGVAVVKTKQQLIDIQDLTINFYDKKTREVEMVVTSPKCLYSTGRRRAVSDEAVRIHRDNITVTGVGFEWVDSVDRKEFVIKSDARVELRNMDKSALEGKKENDDAK